MEHAGKVIFGQVGELLVYFRRKVPDFRYFDFWGIYGPKSGKFEVQISHRNPYIFEISV